MGEEARLLSIAVVSVVALIVLIARFRLNAFVALLLASLIVGLGSGTESAAVVQAIAEGVGGVLGSVAIVIGLGTMIGKLLAESGGAEVMAGAIVDWCGERNVHWAMMIAGLAVGIAVWFTVGLVLLIPIAYSLARRTGRSILLTGIPMVAGLSVMHGLVPPHPGPIAAIGLVGADTGLTILYSLLVAVPVAVLAGPILAGWMSRRMVIEAGGMAAQFERRTAAVAPPGLGWTVATVVFPVGLMLGGAIVDAVARSTAGGAGEAGFLSGVRPWAAFVGSPTVAMLLGLMLALYSFGTARGFDRHQLGKFLEECLAPIALVLLVVGGGGGFSRVLDVSGVGAAIGTMAQGLDVPLLLLGWLIAAVMRIAVGSATVAVTTAAGMVASLAAGTETSPELLVIAMGAGSLILSHVNDGGFWFVKEYFGMSVSETLKTWTVLETLIAVLGLVFVVVLDWVV